jgi:hypothetical protein
MLHRGSWREETQRNQRSAGVILALDEGAPVALRTRTALFCRRNQSLIIVSLP